ncbi:MAG TPA: nucleotide-binding protein [Thermoanaerobaculia bacterium]|nr:nucleotide-binding protein [Thermoanaerobaculia bacterium]
MREYEEEGWHVFEEKTTKSFAVFKVDASHGLDRRLSGLVTRYEWEGASCHILAPGSEGWLTFEGGVVKCKIRVAWYFAWAKSTILSQIRTTTLDVCGTLALTGKTVFIVHGHNIAKRDELQALLGGLGLQTIVLDAEDSMGMTIIEKLEFYAQTCAFAIVLMTPDDLAGANVRARQNVVLELGWFMAKLGRQRVLLLYTGDVEIPSDIMGIVYLHFKDSIREIEGRIQQRLRGCGMIA